MIHNGLSNVSGSPLSESSVTLINPYTPYTGAPSSVPSISPQLLNAEYSGLSSAAVAHFAAYDQRAEEAQTANAAASVADNGLNTIHNLVTQAKTLAQAAGSLGNSPEQQTFIQGQISLLLQRVDQVSSSTKFQGKSLLNGSISGYTPATNASVKVTQNSALSSSSSNLLSSLTYAHGATTLQSGTFELQVVNTGSTIATQVYFISSAPGAAATLLTTVAGAHAATLSYDDVRLNISAVATADVNASAYVNVRAHVAASGATASQYIVHLGPATNQTVSFGISDVSTSALRISGINVAPTQNTAYQIASTNAVNLLNNALNTVAANQASVKSASQKLLAAYGFLKL